MHEQQQNDDGNTCYLDAVWCFQQYSILEPRDLRWRISSHIAMDVDFTAHTVARFLRESARIGQN